MRSVTTLAALSALSSTVAGHATWQQLWVNGEDLESTCVRLPASNNPITDVTSNDLRCNAGSAAAASNCAVKAGDTVTIEMHQHNSRGCTEEAIGGAHYGPVLAYMSKVDDAATADGSSSWFKVYQDTWGKASSTSQGSDDFWGTKDLNTNCGTMDFTIPSDLAAGDYLLRSEAIALHSASGVGGAQFYMSCYQLTVTGDGSATPAGVSFPGAYDAADAGIQINIYQQLSTYVAPGPTVVAGGTEATAGQAPGGSATATGGASATSAEATTLQTSTSAVAAPTGTSGACSAAKYAQCGGNGFSGCSTCASGTTCTTQNDYYSQCL
ncbi:hypothetical protein P280DRAFT_532065 [Massarina eburnea CBS 473.64]|uniref:AA9 family lytic polysaccharide monooxygenase n=1 Tax=Massarina eburnea CBS 473.64 TaxID=1395130 RepID=A0A6A6SF81_9PLEO|nr:hypothetical protein P280DRAFT_532065 [Massarina eburnea CBS 473.64]